LSSDSENGEEQKHEERVDSVVNSIVRPNLDLHQ